MRVDDDDVWRSVVVEGAQNCRPRSDARQEAADLEVLRVEASDLELVEVAVGGVPHELHRFAAEKGLGRPTIRTTLRVNFRFADERGGQRAGDDDDGDECQADGERKWDTSAGFLRMFVHATASGPP